MSRPLHRWLFMVAALLLSAAKSPSQPTVELLKGADALAPLIARLGEGGHPVVLHFFATWCGPCREEMPIMRKALLRAEAQGARVAVISLDDKKDRETKVPAFLLQHHVEAPAYLLDAPDPDPVTSLIDSNWQGTMPATFVFRDGKRVASFLDPIRRTTALDEAVKKAAETPH